MSEFIVGARGHDFGRRSVEELLRSIGDAGFRCTQLAYTKAVEGVKSYADVTPELVAATNAAVQKSGVSIAVDGTYVELSYADEDKRRAEVAKALSQVPVAKALRAGCMGSETTNMAKQPTVSRREAQEALLRSLGEILPVCEEQGVLFAVECVYYHAMNTPEAVRMVLDTIASPTCGSSAIWRTTSAPRTPRWTHSAASGTKSAAGTATRSWPSTSRVRTSSPTAPSTPPASRTPVWTTGAASRCCAPCPSLFSPSCGKRLSRPAPPAILRS